MNTANMMDDSLPDEGLTVLQTVRDIEAAYTFTEDNSTHDEYLVNSDSGERAQFNVVGVAVEARLPPINDDKWKRYLFDICSCNM